jgi:hypothetical protein
MPQTPWSASTPGKFKNETGAQQIKMAPKIEAIRRKSNFIWRWQAKAALPQTLYRLASETEAGQVAIAVGDAGAGHQQPVNGGHQAGEQRTGGYEVDESSLGHLGPLFLKRGAVPLRDLGSIYVYQIPAATDLFA